MKKSKIVKWLFGILFIMGFLWFGSSRFVNDMFILRKLKNEFNDQIQKPQNLDYFKASSSYEKSIFEPKLINVETGDTIDFKKYRGKAVFINYWFTTCRACLEEFPSLEQFYEDKNDKLNFFFITYERPETVKKFLVKKIYKLPFYSIASGAFPAATRAYPTSFLYVKDKPVFRHVGRGYFDTTEFYEYIDTKLQNP